MLSERPSARADLLSSIVWIVLGGAIIYGSWTMDRLEYMNINPYTAPGLVPGILGAGLVLLGTILLIRAVRSGALSRDTAGFDRAGWGRFGLALVLCLFYAAGMVGRGLPFWLATAIFVFLFVLLFELPARRAQGAIARGVVLAVIYAAGTAFLVTVVFEDLFLVRLP